MAGSQLCCAVDPPRQALCLHMAYRILYPNLLPHLPFLLIIIANPNNPKEKETLTKTKDVAHEGVCTLCHRAPDSASPVDLGRPRHIFVFHHCGMPFWIEFFSILARFSLPTCLQKKTKMHQKSMPRGTPSWTSNFDRFLIAFCSELGPR